MCDNFYVFLNLCFINLLFSHSDLTFAKNCTGNFHRVLSVITMPVFRHRVVFN